jgi:CheY-like chemotaxis protein
MGRSLPDAASTTIGSRADEIGAQIVLIVEPNSRTRSVIRSVLAREGFEVRAATNAEEGWGQMAGARTLPAIVLAEAKLEGPDGFAFCNRVRSDPRTAQVPIILMSRGSGGENEDLATQSGADDFVCKPAFAKDLVSLVKLRAGLPSQETRFRETTQKLPLAMLLRAVLSGVRSGRIELDQGAGQITFRHGGVVDAYFGRSRGADALLPLLLLTEGGYTVTFSRTLVKGQFFAGLQELCGTVLPTVSKWLEADDRLSLGESLVVDFVALRQSLPEIPEATHQVIRLFDGHRTVRDCVIASPLSEANTLASIERLFRMGVLVSRGAAKSHAGEPAKLPAATRPPPKVRAAEAYQNVHHLLGEEAAPEAKAPPSSLRAALQIGAAVVGVVAVAAGAAWVVSRGESGRLQRAAIASSKGAVPVNPGRDFGEGVTLFETGNTLEAVKVLSHNAQSSPSPAGWFLLGLAKFEAGDNEGARQAVVEALKLNPRHGRARMLLAAIYLNASQSALATAELKRYLELEPQGPYAAQARLLLSSP